jgi:hypothetical protein
MSKEELEAEVARLQGKLAAANKPKPLSIKVSQKGAVSLYGMGRFPVTLYAAQFTRLIEHGPAILAFIETNRPSLNFKGE